MDLTIANEQHPNIPTQTPKDSNDFRQDKTRYTPRDSNDFRQDKARQQITFILISEDNSRNKRYQMKDKPGLVQRKVKLEISFQFKWRDSSMSKGLLTNAHLRTLASPP